MELPYLKKKHKMGGTIAMTAMKTMDEPGDDSHLRRAIVREMFDAIESKNEESFCSAFEALVLNIKDADEASGE